MLKIFRKSADSVKLDAKSRKVLRAAFSSDAASADRAADAPFLFARIKAKINVERQRNAEVESWRALIGVMWRAAPAMILIAIFSVTLFFIAAPQVSDANENLVLDAPASEVERIVFTERRAGTITGDEILATILDKD
jgi:hypothetical protein